MRKILDLGGFRHGRLDASKPKKIKSTHSCLPKQMQNCDSKKDCSTYF